MKNEIVNICEMCAAVYQVSNTIRKQIDGIYCPACGSLNDLRDHVSQHNSQSVYDAILFLVLDKTAITTVPKPEEKKYKKIQKKIKKDGKKKKSLAIKTRWPEAKKKIEKQQKPSKQTVIRRKKMVQITFTKPILPEQLFGEIKEVYPESNPRISEKFDWGKWGKKYIIVDIAETEIDNVSKIVQSHIPPKSALVTDATDEKTVDLWPDASNALMIAVDQRVKLQVSKLDKQYAETFDGLQKSADATLKAVGAIETSAQKNSTAANKRFSANEKELQDMQAKYNGLQKKYADLEEKYSALANQMASAQKQISTISTQIKTISGENLPQINKVVSMLQTVGKSLSQI